MSEILHDNVQLDERRVKTRSIVFKLDIDSSDAPESHNITGVPLDVVYTRNEGDTATADAIEDHTAGCPCWANNFTAPVDTSGITGFLIDASVLENGSQVIDEVLGVKLLRGFHPIYACGSLDDRDIIDLLGENVCVSGVSTPSGVTLGGNIAFELTSAGIDFAATDYTQVFEVIYTIR